MVKLIATDLDGTLFYPKYRISGIPLSNKVFLKRYLDEGGKLILVSGRNPKIVPKVEFQLQHKVSLIGCNGGYYVDEDKKIHNPIPFDREKVVELFAYTHRVFNPWIWMLFDQGNADYVYAKEIPTYINKIFHIGNRCNNFFAETFIDGDERFINKLANSDNFKLMVVFGSSDDGHKKAEQVAPALRSRFGDYFEIAVSIGVIEITAKGVNKGAALTKYCLDNNIDIDDVAVCGDSGNDLYMFEKFPHTFAMEHSADSFKSQANHIIKKISDLNEYVKNPSLLENDIVKPINYEKALDI